MLVCLGRKHRLNHGKVTSMAEKRREEPEWWLKCQGTGLREKARHELETSPARRRLPARLFLCEDGRDEEEADFGKNRQRPRLTHKQVT
jgi:hypothetical protein